MLNQDEELWEKELSSSVEALLGQEALSDRGGSFQSIALVQFQILTTFCFFDCRILFIIGLQSILCYYDYYYVLEIVYRNCIINNNSQNNFIIINIFVKID